MRLQKQSSRSKKDPNFEKYAKWVLVIPDEEIQKAGFEEGQMLVAYTKKGQMTIVPFSIQHIADNRRSLGMPLDKHKFSMKEIRQGYEKWSNFGSKDKKKIEKRG